MKINLSYTKNLLISNTAKIMGYLILLIVVGLISLRAGLLELLNGEWRNPLFWFGAGMFLLGILWTKLLEFYLKWQNRFQDRTDEVIRRSYLGYEGEKIFFDWANKLFDRENYKQFPNFVIPNENWDIDLVVVGPKGTLLFEVKNLTHPIKFIDEKAFAMDGKRTFNPVEETKRHTNALAKYLESRGYKQIKIKPCLIILGTEVTIIGKTGIYIVDTEEKFKQHINKLLEEPTYTKKLCEEIAEILGNK